MKKGVIAILTYIFRYWITWPRVNRRITEICQEILKKAEGYPHKKLFVMMVGFSRVGKTTLIENHPVLKTMFCVSSMDIHDMLNKKFLLLQDNKTIFGIGYWLRQLLTAEIRQRVHSHLLENGIAFINDSCNLTRQQRQCAIAEARAFGFKTQIIWVFMEEEKLLARLRELDWLLIEKDEKPAWMDLYRRVQKPRFEEPEMSEVDKLQYFRSDDNWAPDIVDVVL